MNAEIAAIDRRIAEAFITEPGGFRPVSHETQY